MTFNYFQWVILPRSKTTPIESKFGRGSGGTNGKSDETGSLLTLLWRCKWARTWQLDTDVECQGRETTRHLQCAGCRRSYNSLIASGILLKGHSILFGSSFSKKQKQYSWIQSNLILKEKLRILEKSWFMALDWLKT